MSQYLPEWPAEARDATTFVDLFRECTTVWPAVLADVQRVGVPAERYAADLHRLARRAAAEPESRKADLWHTLNGVLQHCMREYDPAKGGFHPFFERTLRQMLRRDHARSRMNLPYRRPWDPKAEAHWVRRAVLADRDQSKAYRCFDRWAVRLVDRAVPRLDPQAQVFVRMYYQEQRTHEEVADVLGLAPSTVRKRFSEDRVAGLLKAAVRKVVLALPAEHLVLLTRHLTEWARLSVPQVRDLLHGVLAVDDTAVVLSEHEMVAALGWPDRKSF
jgi:RNA polymerase sigma factor (sigma-70 family)